MDNNINLSAEAIRVINDLQHSKGTYQYYRETLDRLSSFILHQSDEIGMDDTEAIHTLRVIDSIRMDLKALAGTNGESTDECRSSLPGDEAGDE